MDHGEIYRRLTDINHRLVDVSSLPNWREETAKLYYEEAATWSDACRLEGAPMWAKYAASILSGNVRRHADKLLTGESVFGP